MLVDISQLFQAVRAGITTNVGSNEFLKRYKSQYPHILVGCTYRPESFGTLEKNLEALSYLYTLGIKEVRLGLRWSEIEKNKGELDLSLYKPIIQDLLDHGCNITLNIGPIKSAGWPEQFIPDWVLDECNIEQKHCVIPGDDVAQKSLYYLNLLLTQLVSEFGNDFCKVIQPENECFNIFGELKTYASSEYISELISIINSKLDNPQILLNSAGRLDINNIFQVAENFPGTQFIVGYNYYFVFHQTAKFYPYSKFIDGFTIFKFKDLFTKTPQNCTFEVTEMQFEPWGDAWWPGNDFEAFAYGMWRCGQVSRGQNPFVVRLWGIEKLLKKMIKDGLTNEHKQIISVLQGYNKIHF